MVFLREWKLVYRTEVPCKTTDANDKASEILLWGAFSHMCRGSESL